MVKTQLESKSKPVKSAAGGPTVLRFKARLSQPPGPAKTESWILELPKAVGRELQGMDRLEGTINGHPFRAPLEADVTGGLYLRVNKAMRSGAKAELGDNVQLAVLGPETEVAIPTDLRRPLKASAAASKLWAELPDAAQRDYVRWIEMAKTPETRARRVTRTVEQLAEGKRRPCCVNFYEYMLCHVQNEE